MTHLAKITAVEAKLFLREPGHLIIGLLLPDVVLVVIGVIFAPHEPEPGARRASASSTCSAPSMVVISLATLGIQTMPAPAREVPRARRPAPAVDDAGRARPLLLVAQLVDQHRVAIGGAGRAHGRRQPGVPDPAAAAPARLRGRVPARDVVAVRDRAAGRGGRPDAARGERADLAAVRRGDVPGWRVPAALAAARDPASGSATSPRPGVQAHARRVARARRRSCCRWS